MSRPLNLAGARFGRLTALYRIGTDPRQRTALWYCACDCGQGITVRSNALTTLNTQSCGCHRRNQGRLNALWQQRARDGRFTGTPDTHPLPDRPTSD